MKIKTHRYCLILLVAILLSSCKKESEYHTVIDKIEAKQSPYHGDISSDALLVETDLISISEGEHTFMIPERKGQVKSYECTECHSKPLNQMKGSDGQKAHWDIEINHAAVETMNCATCHNPENMNNFNSLTGQDIDFNLSYKVCAQCHANQFEDWKGGAHGKKVAGWAPPRASMTCVNCHNPHDPSFKKRWPEQFNTQTGIERKDGLEGSEEH